MFGPIMRFRTRTELVVEMGPIARNDMPEFIKDGGLQSYEVLKFLGRRLAPVLDDEYHWYDSARTATDKIVWGYYLVEEDRRTLIGSTDLREIGKEFLPCYTATGGVVIFRQDLWGKGIVSACHRALTMYAFDFLGLDAINAGVHVLNLASLNSVVNIGYVPMYVDRESGLHHGKVNQAWQLRQINPNGGWWRNATPPTDEWIEAAKKTKAALAWARANVKLP